MPHVDLVWYRCDLSSSGRDSDVPRSFYSARQNILRALKHHGVRVALVYHHPLLGWSSRPQWDSSLRIIPFLGTGKVGVLFRILTLTLYFGRSIIFERPQVIMTDADGVLAITPWAVLSRIGLIDTCFCLDLRSGPVELPSQKGRHRPRRSRYWLSLWLSSRLMHKFTFITEGLREETESAYGIEFPEAGYWSSGVDTDQFHPVRNPEGGVDDDFVVIYHGEVSPTRGLDDLVAAVALVFAECRGLRLLILGGDRSDASSAQVLEGLESQCVQLGIADRVQFLAPVPHDLVPDILRKADIGVVPWKDRPWWKGQSPLKLLEYFASGLPVVATCIDANRRVIGELPCAVYCEPENPKSMADSIASLYRERNTQIGTFRWRGQIGRALVVEQFTWQLQAERLANHLGLL